MKSLLRISLLSLLFPTLLLGAEPRPMTFQDVMAFRTIQNPIISNDGKWVAYQAQPDRGDAEVIVHEVDGSARYRIALASRPVFSDNGQWLAVRTDESLAASLSRKKGEKPPSSGMLLLSLRSGDQTAFESIRSFAFSAASGHLAMLRIPADPPKEEAKEEAEEDEKKAEKPADVLVLRSLTGGSREIEGVGEVSFDPAQGYLAYLRSARGEEAGGVYLVDLQNSQQDIPLRSQEGEEYAGLSWSKEASRLSFLSTTGKEKEEIARNSRIWLWEGSEIREIPANASLEEGWFLPFKNSLSWSPNSNRLFFGVKLDSEVAALRDAESPSKSTAEVDPTDLDTILEDRELDVWHWRDDYISPQQKLSWNRTRDRTYLALYDVSGGNVLQLADLAVRDVNSGDATESLLGFDDRAYRVQTTWDESYRDLYRIDPHSGQRRKVLEGLVGNQFSSSPTGRYLVYFQNGDWHFHDGKTNSFRNLTSELPVPFANEDHDYPSKVPGYGVALWMEDESGVLIYDKYDIWHFSTAEGRARNLTGGEGRRHRTIFRLEYHDPERPWLRQGEELLLRGYHDLEKWYGFYQLKLGEVGVRPLLRGPKRYRVVAQAKESDRFLFTQESYQEFPDLWVAGPDFSDPRRVSDVNPQIKDFLWGEAELVSWNGLDGRFHQGVLIKPGNYQPGRRYPVLVYFYRFFSQRLHEFNQPVINHRPSFPVYTSNGYAIFLPDIRFEVGRPGLASTKSLLPGVQRLIDMGVADPRAIGLHGHSWSGYQTAHIITHTDMFAAAVAGAPVSNMTSAYGGIRWGSGRARQFQYEKTQSRLGVSLWENPLPFIENSPLFYADRINTPLLIQFGDEDGAVPWYQGIELYLAMRRLGKDCVFLQYRGEPHHLQKYPNKLDYAMKMKEYFDHYLRGYPAPDWISKGVPYTGR